MSLIKTMKDLINTNQRNINGEINAPPAEKLPHVARFGLTQGCSHGKCTFCDIPQEDYKVKSLDEYKAHVISTWDMMSSKERSSKTRIFIGGENGLSAPFDTLREAIPFTIEQFRAYTKRNPRRVAMYANTHDIMGLEERELKLLECGGTCNSGCSIDKFGQKIGLSLLYWGIESGSDEVLKLGGKGYNKNDLFSAISKIRDYSNIRTSVMIMPGLGGILLYRKHVNNTIKVLNELEPDYVTFIGLDVANNTPYKRIMDKAISNGDNDYLTPSQIVNQTADIIDGINFRTVIGIHGKNIHSYGYNPVAIGSREMIFRSDKYILAEELRDRSRNLS